MWTERTNPTKQHRFDIRSNTLSDGFLGDLSFPQLIHSVNALCRPHFILMNSECLKYK